MRQRQTSVAKLLRREKEALLPKVRQLSQEGCGPQAIAEMLGQKVSVIERWLLELEPRGVQRARKKASLTARLVRRYKTIYYEAMHEWARTLRVKAEAASDPKAPAATEEAAIEETTNKKTVTKGTAPAAKKAAKQLTAAQKNAARQAKDAAARERKKSLPPRPVGSYALLSKAMDALKAIREIRGVDAPRQTEIAGPGGTPIPLSALQVDDLSRMSDEELTLLEARLRAECEPQAPAVEPPPQQLLPSEPRP